MATRKRTTKSVKLTAAEAREKVEELQYKLDKYAGTAHCPMCDKHKDVETKFYYDTDPLLGGKSFSRICRDCAKKIALRVDENGMEHEPTKESVQKALYYLNKPFLEIVWNASIQESENMVTGKNKDNVWTSYIKNISMKNYVGMGYMDSDMFKDKIVYADEKPLQKNKEEELSEDVIEMYKKNKRTVLRFLGYDPFENEPISEQPILYSKLVIIGNTNRIWCMSQDQIEEMSEPLQKKWKEYQALLAEYQDDFAMLWNRWNKYTDEIMYWQSGRSPIIEGIPGTEDAAGYCKKIYNDLISQITYGCVRSKNTTLQKLSKDILDYATLLCPTGY